MQKVITQHIFLKRIEATKTVHQALKRNRNTTGKILFELFYPTHDAQSSSSFSSSSSSFEHEESIFSQVQRGERLRELISSLSKKNEVKNCTLS